MANQMIFPPARTFIFYEGPSMLDRTQEVIGIIQLNVSKASKLEDMAQIWIFPAAIKKIVRDWLKNKKSGKPNVASPCKTMLDGGLDSVCCHNCPMRSKASGGRGECYCHGRVLMLGANQLLKSLCNRGWPTLGFRDFREELEQLVKNGTQLRISAYGEPGTLPDLYLMLMQDVPGTRYMHSWAELPPERSELFKRHFMASVESPEMEQRAWAEGWRPFVVMEEENYSIDKRTQFPCPASAEMGRRTSCGPCKGCQGKQNSFSKAPVIMNHSRELNLMKAKRRLLELRTL